MRPKIDGAVHAPDDGMLRPYDDLERIVHQVIGCAIEVHRVLGPGLLESIYHECLPFELTAKGLRFEADKCVPVDYKGRRVGAGFKLDLVVEDCVIVEMKAVQALHPVHEAQVITYLKLTGCPAGVLLNFNTVLLRDGLRRLDHPDRYKQKKGRSDEEAESGS
jgi:GxxExxY protein